jgi:RNA polymerase sigma-70 factor (ECF subfamily)
VNDIVQETYVELFRAMRKRKIRDIRPFIFGIVRNKLKKYYGFKTKLRERFINKSIDDETVVDRLRDDFDLEKYVLEKITKDEIWAYLDKKNVVTAKIFYLYYGEDVTIKEVARELKLNESTVKNHLYRTLKELNELFGKEGDENV